ncbi:MAG: hypothetical protein IKO64_04075 [Kiritimatiellae bacterium]|nr:hypothetical protein [Kiritimatiellia bacterium]MBR4523395.1 hypothetical protein [Kiritimatiellia bacterium]
MFKKLTLFLAFAAALAGCGPFWVDPYIVVQESQLNWVEIHYYNLKRTPIRRIAVYMNGMGHVEVKKGTSERVSNDFAKRYREDEWRDLSVRRMDVDPAHIKDLMQNLVNHGLLDREKTGRKADKDAYDRFIAVKANINNNTYSAQENIFEVDPDLAEQLLDVIREFDNPVAK